MLWFHCGGGLCENRRPLVLWRFWARDESRTVLEESVGWTLSGRSRERNTDFLGDFPEEPCPTDELPLWVGWCSVGVVDVRSNPSQGAGVDAAFTFNYLD